MYYIETFGVINGLDLYLALGIQNLPDGVITWVQMDMEDEVVWVFTESSISGTVGATQSVFDLLSQYGIHYVVHLG
ncbi:MAG TPA: hypothetical protein DCW43_00885 [Clostridiales bacterium]|nr:hypothetical protein [Clostridiales bacterium]